MLTKKQLELLRFLEKKINSSGVSPSFEEMKFALGLRSKSGIHRLICALEERGFLRKLPHRARSIEILRSPSSLIGSKHTEKKSLPAKNEFPDCSIACVWGVSPTPDSYPFWVGIGIWSAFPFPHATCIIRLQCMSDMQLAKS